MAELINLRSQATYLTKTLHDMGAFRYVSNPNKWSTLALVATASPSQAPVLFGFIDQYLKFETSIFVDPKVSWSS